MKFHQIPGFSSQWTVGIRQPREALTQRVSQYWMLTSALYRGPPSLFLPCSHWGSPPCLPQGHGLQPLQAPPQWPEHRAQVQLLGPERCRLWERGVPSAGKLDWKLCFNGSLSPGQPERIASYVPLRTSGRAAQNEH